MLVTLRDGHTQAYSPRQVADHKAQQGVSLGLTLSVEGIVLTVTPGSAAARAELKPGLQILSIDDQRVTDRAAALRAELSLGEPPALTRAQSRLADRLIGVRLLRGAPGTTATLQVAT
jgi:S1-C subfamily serine protease